MDNAFHRTLGVALSVGQQVAVDEICLRFEESLKAGQQPSIEQWVAEADEPLREQLRRELEITESQYRTRTESVPLGTFIERLVYSGLMTAAELRQFQHTISPEDRPKTAEDLAKAMFRQGRLTKFQAHAVYQGKTRGLVMGNYVVLDRIGAGGIGEGYKARHRRMDRIVALKLLAPSQVRSPEAVRRFSQCEVPAAAKLSHPNIVTAYEADEHNGTYFLAMEFVEGQDLAAVVRNLGPLSPAKAVEYIVQAAKGLDYAHQRGVLARELRSCARSRTSPFSKWQALRPPHRALPDYRVRCLRARSWLTPRYRASLTTYQRNNWLLWTFVEIHCAGTPQVRRSPCPTTSTRTTRGLGFRSRSSPRTTTACWASRASRKIPE
jgi:hypothetical protein